MSDPREADERRFIDQLSLVPRIEGAITAAVTDDVQDLRSAEVSDGVEIFLQGDVRLLEDLIIARRHYSAISTLMRHTADRGDSDDATESAAILSRAIQELLFQVVWLAAFPPPADLNVTFPVEVGDPDIVRDARQHEWGERRVGGVWVTVLRPHIVKEPTQPTQGPGPGSNREGRETNPCWVRQRMRSDVPP